MQTCLRKTISVILSLVSLLTFFDFYSYAQQIADSSFDYAIPHPMYAPGKGTEITLDEAHLNFHTLNGRYYPFGRLLQKDGYQLKPGMEKFSDSSLSGVKMLVIANALGDTGEWVLPAKSAFAADEIAALKKWVSGGGRLFLIADHMPFAGAASGLAQAFGFNFIDGFAIRKDRAQEIFSRARNNLNPNVITDGRNKTERVDSVCVFTGQAFVAPKNAVAMTSLENDYDIFLPDTAWIFNDQTPRMSGTGLTNGAYMEYGKGRLVVMGEAAMFSAQLAGPQRRPAGMNMLVARQNPLFLLNIVHWLDRKL